ncbi:MAG: hypothetical protein K6U89_17595 [Chloroflexi bacterium]|nr:hypothetical protein [Chloroflexota bacterium]
MNALLRDSFVLVRYGLRAELGRLRCLSRGQRTGLALTLGVLLILMILLASALAQARLSQEAAAAALTGAYLASGLLLLATALPLGVAFFDDRGELPFLLATPVQPAAVIASRLVVIAGWEGLLALALLVPLTVGLGLALGAGPLYYLLALAVLPLVPLLPLALAHLVAFLLLRLLPPRVVQTVLALAGALLGGSWVLARAETPAEFGTQLADGLGTLGRTAPWLPFAWPAEALLGGVGGEGALLPVLGFVALALVAFVAATGLGVAVVRAGWYDAIPRAGSRRREGRPRSLGQGPVAAILLKDWRILYRDPNVWARLLGPLVFFGVVVWQAVVQAATLAGPGGALIKEVTVVGAGIFLAWNLNNRLAVTAFNRDRRGILWTLVSPTPPTQLLVAKLLVALLPELAIIGPLTLVLCLVEQLPPATTGRLVLALPFLLLVLVAVSILVGVHYPKFDWRDPRRVTPVAATLWVTLLHASVLAGGVVVLVGVPRLLPLGGALGVLALVGLAALALLAFLRHGAAQIARWEVGGW